MIGGTSSSFITPAVPKAHPEPDFELLMAIQEEEKQNRVFLKAGIGINASLLKNNLNHAPRT